MTISIWRYSHFALAIASSLFLLIASLTGVILAVEPISHQTKGYAVQDLNEVSLATTIDALKNSYDEVFSLEVESSGFVKASVLTPEIETLDIYINPKTGEKLGEVQERPAIYSFATNLHRSLFLKSIGRFFVGFISLLLFLIALTGLFLLAKRQGGFKRLFSKVQKDYFELRYHVLLSRWFFIPISILALTGVYLSAEKFELFPNASIQHAEIVSITEDESIEGIKNSSFFKETTLDYVRKVDFPFSEDPEEYYQIALKDVEVRVNQHSGQIISSAEYPFVAIASRASLILHTGKGSILWSIFLLLASASILFFMYSGFAMTLKRRKKGAVVAMQDKDECELIIMVGSETGTAFDFARRFYNELSSAGKKVYLTELNNYSVFAKAKHFIIFTSTYGEGEPPTNARKFEAIFSTIQQPNKINYSVVGFGSLEYPHYCQFAIKVDALLQACKDFQPLLPLNKIDNADVTAFDDWSKQWGNQIGIPVIIKHVTKSKKKRKQFSFKIVKRTELNVDDTFLLQIKPLQKIPFTSGDLLSIIPNGSNSVRQYSIARIGNDILLSIKKHEFGRGSSYLYSLKKGDHIKAAVETNLHFHFPKKSPSAVLIANGTGIAPFLGMIEQNTTKKIHLFWGGRTIASAGIYDEFLKKRIFHNEDITIQICFSREETKMYVQHLVEQQKDIILNTVKEGGALMLCGSLAMQNDVFEILGKLLTENHTMGLDELKHRGQLMMDCY